MIIQREIEDVMLAIDELVQARIAVQVTSLLGGNAKGDGARKIADAVQHHRDRADKARIAICDNLKTVMRTAIDKTPN